jgi:hypothetical protein
MSRFIIGIGSRNYGDQEFQLQSGESGNLVYNLKSEDLRTRNSDVLGEGKTDVLVQREMGNSPFLHLLFYCSLPWIENACPHR